jgi:hypothetical protein
MKLNGLVDVVLNSKERLSKEAKRGGYGKRQGRAQNFVSSGPQNYFVSAWFSRLFAYLERESVITPRLL